MCSEMFSKLLTIIGTVSKIQQNYETTYNKYNKTMKLHTTNITKKTI